MFVQAGVHGKKRCGGITIPQSRNLKPRVSFDMGSSLCGSVSQCQLSSAKPHQPKIYNFFSAATSLGCSWDTGSFAGFLLLKAVPSREGHCLWETVGADRDAWDVNLSWLLCSDLVTVTRGPFWSARTWTGCVLWNVCSYAKYCWI